MQIVKIVLIRAPGSISGVKGLWAYVAQRILQIVDGGNARFMDSQRSLSPRVVDWLMWSVFELVALHPSALHIEFQARIHQALAMIDKQATYTSHPSSPALGPTLSPSTSQQYYPVRTRLSSNRSSSFIGHARSSSNVGLDHTPFASPDRLTTANLAVTPSRNRINSNISSPSHSPSPLSSPLVRSHGVGPEVEVIHSRSPSQVKSQVLALLEPHVHLLLLSQHVVSPDLSLKRSLQLTRPKTGSPLPLVLPIWATHLRRLAVQSCTF